jgi:hypothetical protein
MKGWIILVLVLVLLGVGYFVFAPGPETIVDGDSPLKNIDDAGFEAAVNLVKDEVKVLDEEMDEAAELISMGDFMESAHHVEGKALLIEEDGKKIVRFEDFDTINGPALYIYLSSDLGDDDFVNLGEIKATSGNVNYEVPEGVDTEKYNNVLVWCEPFSVLFSYAELK